VVKLFKCFVMFPIMCFALYAGVVVNGQQVPNNGMVMLSKNISKQDVGIQGSGIYYLLQNIPVSITDSSRYRIVCTSDGLAPLFNSNCKFYLQFNGSQTPISLLSMQNGVQLNQGSVNGALSTQLSIMVQGQNPVSTDQVGNSKVCNVMIYYGNDLQNVVTVQLNITYNPSDINKPNGNASDIQKPAFSTEQLIFDLGENNQIYQKPTVTNATKTASFYSATRNLCVTYLPGYVEDCGVPYGYSLSVNHETPQVGRFDTEGSGYAALSPTDDQYAPFGFQLTIFPVNPNDVYTKEGIVSINGQFVLTYFN